MSDRTIKVLLIENNPGDARLIQEQLSKTKGTSFDTEVCQMLSKGIEALASEKFDVILLDLGLPDSSGIETLFKIQSVAPHKPVIVMTGFDDEETAIISVRKGARDYLFREQLASEGLLSKTVRYALERSRADLEKETISAISQRFLSSETIDETYSELSKMLSDRFHFPIVAIELYDKDSNEMVFVNSVGIPLESDTEAMRVPADESISGLVARTGEPVSELNASHHPNYRFHVLKKLKIETFLCVPMKIRGEVLGTLALADSIRREEDISLMDTLRIVADYLGQEIARKQVNKELMKAKETAVSASMAKSAFMGVISHELRTPLNHILGFSGILIKDQSLTEKQKEYVNVIKRSGDHLLMIINDVIDLCRIEAGKMTIRKNEMYLTGFLEEIVSMFQLRSRQKRISFTTDFAPDLPVAVYVDEKRLRQILINVLGNAVKFTEKGSVIFRAVPQPENRIRFQVEDTGIGIPPDHLEEVFSSFHQVEFYHHHTEGTGLGLAVSQRLAEMMGSRLFVSSTLDQGSIFWFDIECMSPWQKAVIPEEERSKVLIVTDEKANHTMLDEQFSPMGFHVESVNNAEEIADKAAKHHPNMIITDMAETETDTIKAIQHIRKTPELKKVFIIAAIPEETSKDTWDEIAGAGCDDYILKPFEAEDLLDAMERYLL